MNNLFEVISVRYKVDLVVRVDESANTVTRNQQIIPILDKITKQHYKSNIRR